MARCRRPGERVDAAVAQPPIGRILRAPGRSASTLEHFDAVRARDVTVRRRRRAAGAVSTITWDTMNSIGRSSRRSAAGARRRRPIAQMHLSPRASCRPSSAAAPLRCALFTCSRTSISLRPAFDKRFDPQAVESGGKFAEMHRFLARAGQKSPQLVGRHRQDRRQQPRQPVRDPIHRRLRRPPRVRVGAERVEPILRHVEVERAQVDRQQRVERVEDRWEVVAPRTPRRSALALARIAPARSDRPRRSRASGTRRWPDRSRRGSTQQIPERVADLAVGLDHPRQDLVARSGLPRDSRPSPTQSRRISAPLCLITSCGSMALPSDFDIFRPCSSTTKPWVMTSRYGARPRVPMPTSSELWNQPRY